jgi:hypothetical protein
VKQSELMRFVLALVSALICACVPAGVAPAAVGSRQAWFYSTTTLQPSTAPVLWCSFVTEASAKAAANSDRFWHVESGWLRYRGNAIESLMVISQSEDSYVEDSYTFGPDLAVKEVVRRGHYINDPFATAIFRPDESGHLSMTAKSRRALQSWEREHATYFFGWPLYATFAEIPFARLIDMKSGIAVTEACRETSS